MGTFNTSPSTCIVMQSEVPVAMVFDGSTEHRFGQHVGARLSDDVVSGRGSLTGTVHNDGCGQSRARRSRFFREVVVEATVQAGFTTVLLHAAHTPSREMRG